VEQVTATQQMGTHMDGLNHLQMGERTYNGFLLADIIEDHGTNRLGIDTLPQVVTRGLLLDVAASRGGERLHVLRPHRAVRDAGVQELRSLISRYPKSPEALQARDRLTKLGAAGAASKPSRPSPSHR